MLRAIIGYVLGFLSGASTMVAIIAATPSAIFSAVTFSIITFVAAVVFAHRHHIKMRNKYYDRLKNGVSEWHI